jgi:hypothetical protein
LARTWAPNLKRLLETRHQESKGPQSNIVTPGIINDGHLAPQQAHLQAHLHRNTMQSDQQSETSFPLKQRVLPPKGTDGNTYT